jgi:hypothetical protein
MAEAFVKTFKRDYLRVGLIPNAAAALALINSWRRITKSVTRPPDWTADHHASTQPVACPV